MIGSLLIARLFSIPVRIHWTFVLLVAWLAYANYSIAGYFNWYALTWTMLTIIALFICVVLHELGHALAARRYGVHTRSILLLPIGGLALLDRLPNKPIQEFLVALAGPLVNVFLCFLFLPIAMFFAHESMDQIILFWLHPQGNVFLREATPFNYFLVGMVAVNALIALFNLIPAFPMDGGRILRALLSMVLNRPRATLIAVRIGQLIALGLLLLSWKDFNWPVAVIGVYVFFSAQGEWRNVKRDRLLEGIKVEEATRLKFTTFYTQDKAADVWHEMKHGLERDFLVFDEWHNLKGVISQDDILELKTNRRKDWQTVFLKDCLHPQKEAFLASEWINTAIATMQAQRQSIFPVLDKYGEIKGVLDSDAIERFIRIQRKAG